jgi:hypothetical protein
MGHRIKILENFISKDDASAIISMLESLKNNGGLIPFVDNDRVSVAPSNYYPTELMIKKYSDLLIHEHKKEFGIAKDLFTVQGHASLWENGSFADEHVDSHDGSEHIITSSVIYLGGEFSGGEITFPNQAFTYRPKALSAVIFPSGGREYPHSVSRINSGERFTIAMWHSLDHHFSIGEYNKGIGNDDVASIWATDHRGPMAACPTGR